MRVATPRRPSSDVPLPPVTATRGRGGGGGWVVVTTAPNRIVAHIILGRLTEDGIEAMLDTTNLSPAAWMYPFGNPAAPVRVLVRSYELELARSLLGVEPVEPTAPGRSSVSPLLIAVTLAIVVLLVLVEIYGFAPCFLHLFCI